MGAIVHKKVEQYLRDVSYSVDRNYVPSKFALEFVTFIKLVNGETGEEHPTPVIHYNMLDQIAGPEHRIANMCYRGVAKSALFAEYLILYIAVYGEIPGFGDISYALYVSDSIDNGVKKMRKRIELRWQNSPFLQHYLPAVYMKPNGFKAETKFTDVTWNFVNKDGKQFVVTGHGAKTGVRGTVELNTRPQLAILDDLISDDDARSKTVIAAVKDVVQKAISKALHPQKYKIIWSGTPFNAGDPLYSAVESGAWKVNVFPVCERYPCTEEEFKGAWPERFDYAYVKDQYDSALLEGSVEAFNQELMLQIMSEEDRLILDEDVRPYNLEKLLENKGAYNFYITTDFATSEKQAADLSTISVWAYNSNGDWFWVDGICCQQLMDKNLDDLFRLASEYNVNLQTVGIEVSGQQGGFISWIMERQMNTNAFFTLASEKNSSKAGIRPVTNKMVRFNLVVPLFKAGKIYYPGNDKGEVDRTNPVIAEHLTELFLATKKGFKSIWDDCIDNISMLGVMSPWKPSAITPFGKNAKNDLWENEDMPDNNEQLDSYIV